MNRPELHWPTVLRTGCATWAIGLLLALLLLPPLLEGLAWLFEIIDRD
ncbi:hypothetical protein [Aurantiacibacter odishensis]|nr:hypothetical protein [Aurantiacibacter odishensis]